MFVGVSEDARGGKVGVFGSGVVEEGVGNSRVSGVWVNAGTPAARGSASHARLHAPCAQVFVPGSLYQCCRRVAKGGGEKHGAYDTVRLRRCAQVSCPAL